MKENMQTDAPQTLDQVKVEFTDLNWKKICIITRYSKQFILDKRVLRPLLLFTFFGQEMFMLGASNLICYAIAPRYLKDKIALNIMTMLLLQTVLKKQLVFVHSIFFDTILKGILQTLKIEIPSWCKDNKEFKEYMKYIGNQIYKEEKEKIERISDQLERWAQDECSQKIIYQKQTLEERAQKEHERIAKENEITKRLEAQKQAEQERAAKEQERDQRLQAQKQAEQERAAKEQERDQRLQAQKQAEQERIAKEEERDQRLKAQQEADMERTAKEKERIAKEKERAAKEEERDQRLQLSKINEISTDLSDLLNNLKQQRKLLVPREERYLMFINGVLEQVKLALELKMLDQVYIDALSTLAAELSNSSIEQISVKFVPTDNKNIKELLVKFSKAIEKINGYLKDQNSITAECYIKSVSQVNCDLSEIEDKLERMRR